MSNRTAHAKRNIVAGVLNNVVSMGFPFIVRTIIISILGAEYLGLGSLFSAILMVLNMAELGFSRAIVFALYKPIAKQEDNYVCALLLFFRRIYTIVGVSIFVIGLFLTPFIPRIIKGSYPDDINIYVLFLIYLANTSFSYLFFAYKSVILTADQRQNVISNVGTIVGLIKGIFQIVSLLIIKNYYFYIVWTIFFTIVQNVIIAIITSREYPQYICKGDLDKNTRHRIFQQIKGIGIGKLSQTARNSFDSIVLSMYCGLIDVAIYSNYYYIFAAVTSILGIIVQSIQASVGNSIAVETKEKNYNDFKKLNYYYSWISGWATICMLVLYQPFMVLWVGEKNTASTYIMYLFCLYFYITQIGQIRAVYASAAGLWWEFRVPELLEMLFNIVLNFYLGSKYGMAGILWATIITVAVFSIIAITNITFDKYFERPSLEYYLDLIVQTIIILCVSACVYSICSFVTGEDIFSFLIKVAICLILPNLLFGLLSVPSVKNRRYLKELMLIVRR